MLGLTEEYEVFDSDILTHINSAIFTLSQLGVNDGEFFVVTDVNQTWDEYVENKKLQNIIKNYIFIKTRFVFDPPTHSYVLDSLQKILNELEWRIIIELEVINQNEI